MAGPFIGLFINTCGCRWTTIVGGLLNALGWVLSAYAASVHCLFITFGVAAGKRGFTFDCSVLLVILAMNLIVRKKSHQIMLFCVLHPSYPTLQEIEAVKWGINVGKQHDDHACSLTESDSVF